MGIEAELEAPDHGLQRTLKDLFAGAVGGVAQVLIGMCKLPAQCSCFVHAFKRICVNVP